ncbi:uncharacterized protein LOC135384527 [Ornithodoros turicata]|uniref:uncharacterized protein LOC135384527 n=1 Tax=Ornithodoros turicata TaxID=34597 RepID=UPI00313A3C15
MPPEAAWRFESNVEDAEFGIILPTSVDSLPQDGSLAAPNLHVKFSSWIFRTVNVLSKKELCHLQQYSLIPSSVNVVTYSGERLPIVGEVTVKCSTRNDTHQVTFVVVELCASPILGLEACKRFGLLQRLGSLNRPPVSATTQQDPYELLNSCSDVFEGTGRLPGEHHIMLHANADPSISPARKIPIALEDQFKRELQRMLDQKVIAKVTEPTDWCSPIVIITKADGTLRLCMDPRSLNKAIKRTAYQRRMSCLRAYMEIMPYGVSCAPEEFQRKMDELFQGEPDICPYFDDLLVASANLDDHYKQQARVFEIARKHNMKFNRSELQLVSPMATYLGHVITPEGIRPDPVKVKAISEFPTPTSKIDASSQGLGAVLLQDNRTVAYASAALTESQCRFSQIEKELLAVAGYNGWQKYDLRLEYVPGKDFVIADTLSRAPLQSVTITTVEQTSKQATLALLVTASSGVLDMIRHATIEDEHLQTIIAYCCNGWPPSRRHLSRELQPYWDCQDELHFEQGLLFRGMRLVIPDKC